MKTNKAAALNFGEVLECASPLALSMRNGPAMGKMEATLPSPSPFKAVEDYRTPERCRTVVGALSFREVLECARCCAALDTPVIERGPKSDRTCWIQGALTKAVQRYRTPKRWRAIVGAMLTLLFFLPALPAAEPAKTDLPALLQKGLFEEEVNRNFEAAITEYRAAMGQFDRQRNYGATAIFRLAECLRKAGRKIEADPLYRRVIQEFPDQTNLVQLSHTHLGTGPAPAKFDATNLPAMLDEEAREIQRIAAMVKDSPDLINAPKNAATPLHLAAARAQIKVAVYLLEHGADIECKLRSDNAVVTAKAGSTPLILAAQAGHKAMVELLVKRGALVDAADTGRKTALHWAAENGYKGVAEVLLEAKASVNAVTFDKATPLMLAIGNGHRAMLELLLARGAEVNTAMRTGDTPLHFAASRGYLELAKFLLAAKADLHLKNANGETPLHVAAGEPMIALLCEAGARVNEADHRGYTPLLLALLKTEDALDLLLRFKADPNMAFPNAYNFNNIGNANKPTPVMFAIDRGLSSAVEKLVGNGANVNAQDADGRTALYCAVGAQQTNIVDFLLRNKADPRLGRADGWTPLHYAAAIGRTDLVKWLLDHNAGVNAQTQDGQSPLYVATNSRFKEVMALLLERGADANLANKYGTTPLDLLANASGGLPTPPPARFAPAQPSIAGAPGQALPPAFTPVSGTAEETREILRQHGVSLLTPRPGMIMVCRASTNQKSLVMPENTNGWNRFTLLEIIADDFARPVYMNSKLLPFPDWEQVRIFRRAPDGKAREIPVNVNEIFNGKAKDVPLEWGDVVDIPEKQHLANEQWNNLTTERDSLKRMLDRTVVVQTKNMTNQVKWVPFEQVGPAYGDIKGGPWLSQFLRARQALYLATSDLTRVKVKRTDPATGKAVEFVADATRQDPRTDLWLRDGDVIEIPEKAF